MDAQQAIVTKRDTRSFLPEPVPTGQMTALLKAARMAGSAKNAQLTRLVVVTDADTKVSLAGCGDFTSWIGTTPVIVVIVIPVEDGRLFDAGRMAQNLMISAHALGLATCPVTFHHQDKMREAIGLPADMEGPMGVVLGIPGPAGTPRPRAPRIPLDELVHDERWSG